MGGIANGPQGRDGSTRRMALRRDLEGNAKGNEGRGGTVHNKWHTAQWGKGKSAGGGQGGGG